MSEMDEPTRSTEQMLDVVHLRAAGLRRGRRRRQIAGGLAAVGVLAAGSVMVMTRGNDAIEIATVPHEPGTSAAPATTSPAPASTTTEAAPTTTAPTTTAGSTDAVGLEVRPHGTGSDGLRVTTVGFEELVTPTTGEPGQVVLEYEFGLAFGPDDRAGVVRSDARTSDGQLTVDLQCENPGCSFEPRNDEAQALLSATVSTTEIALSPGRHDVAMVIEFDDGDTIEFELSFWAEAAPSQTYSDQVRASTGAPVEVQRVLDVGRFAYHVTVAFESVWVLGSASRTVTRLDAVTGERLDVFAVAGSWADGRVTSATRVTSTDDAIYVNTAPLTRIDPDTAEISYIDLGDSRFSLIGHGDTLWAAGPAGVRRIDADGAVTDLDTPAANWMDLAVAGDLVWAISQRNENRLIAFDGDTGEIVHDLAIVDGFPDRSAPVRLVADDTTVVVGIDTSGGGGRTGALVLVDPVTGSVTDRIDLGHRPEGIALTPGHIWTSGAVLDRTTLEITDIYIGFTLAVDTAGDGSVWGIGGIPGSANSDSMARRLTPGDHQP